MRGLLDGHDRFRSIYFSDENSLLRRLAEEGRKPEALVITCSDSRVVPEAILGASPGQLFVVRNVGNLVPGRGSGNVSVAAAVEYSLEHLGVRHLVILGHYGCGAIRALAEGAHLPVPHAPGHEEPVIEPEAEPAPATPGDEKQARMLRRRGWMSTPLVRWLDMNGDLARRAGHSLQAGTRPEELLDRMCEENVLLQMEHMISYTPVRERLRTPTLFLHGWVYSIRTGELFLFDHTARKFVAKSAVLRLDAGAPA